MPPKRKRIIASSDLEEQPSAKRRKSAKLSTTNFQSLPDDCLSEILAHLPLLSLCAASFTSKRFNTAFEAFMSRDLTKKFGLSGKAINNLPSSIKAALYPRGQYLAFEELVHVKVMNDDVNLEKRLSKLNNWTVLKISEKINKSKLEELDEGILKIFGGKVVYTDLAPDDTFAFWSDTDSNTNGGKLHVTFFLFGNKDHFVEVTCDLFSYYEHSGGTFTCDLTLNAKLMDGSSPKKCTEVNGLLEGYKEQGVPEFYSDDESDEENEDDENSEDSEEVFRREAKNGDRVKVEWWHDCYPKLNHKKLTQVTKWLGWKMTSINFAKLLVNLCFEPRYEGYAADIDTSDTKASLEAITKLVLNDEDEWLSQVERTLDLLTAKMKLKNRIRNEWKKKSKSKLTSALSLIDRSMYPAWSLTEGEADVGVFIHYKELQGEIKLNSDDPAKWVRFKFDIGLCREELDKLSDDDRFNHTISTSSEEGKMKEFVFEAWTVSKDEVKLIKNELGLASYTDKEIIELLAMIADHPLKGLSLKKE